MGIVRTFARREDARILAGQSQFLDDIHPEGTLHMAFTRSPHAHARVSNIKGPGPFMLTAETLRGHVTPARIDPPPGLEVADAPHPLLADGEVHYVGQAVAAVVGESRALAEDAADAVEVSYEPLDAVVDPRAADWLVRWEQRAGDVAGAFARAAHVVRAEHVIPRLAAAPLEPRGALASFDGERLTLWTSSESAHRPRAQLAQMLGLPESAIRVIVPDVGGGFGSKGTLPVEAAVVALAAIELKRPVKWVEDRRENFLAAPQARGMRAAVELALDADGRILALRGRLLADLGAFLLPSTAIPPHTTAMLLAGSYDIPAVEVIVSGARTDKVPTAPYRGAGRAEATYLIETTIDAAARELRLDPVDLRRRNLVREFPHRTALGWTYDSGDYERCLDRALELLGDEPAPEPDRGGWLEAPSGTPGAWWGAPPVGPGATVAAGAARQAADVLVGTGVALCVVRTGGLYEYAEVRVEDGDVLVLVGSIPSGQGHETLFAQIAAEALGVDPERVTVRHGDTDAVADGVGSFTSRSTAMGGSAVAEAAAEAREHGSGRSRFTSDQVFSSGAYAARVEVSKATGAVRVTKLVAVDDAGRIINAALAHGQVLGGAVQGLGAALTEEVVGDPFDYGLLTAAEIPEFFTDFVESPSPLNPLGAKGISENGPTGTPAAVANALANALGRRVDPPFTAAKVWRALP